jgi:hypothetical protein
MDFSSEQMPGAGGGGAGAIGENAIAGNGGNGGDSISALIKLEPGETYEIEIGNGAKGGALPGQHGQDGAASAFRVRSSDGTLKQNIQATGGAGGKAGDLPDDATEISQTDLAGGFRISTLMLINTVETREGLLFILGGGWEGYKIQQLPHDAIWPVICIASWKVLDTAAPKWLQLCVLDPQGIEVTRIALALPLDALSLTSWCWVVPIGAPLNSEGLWAVRVQSGEFLLSQIEVRVDLIQ